MTPVPAPQPTPSEDGPDLGSVLTAAAAGDASAFETLYRRFAPVVHGIALARVGRTEAEDVVQETFVALHRGLGRIRDPRALPGWLRTVATNAANDRWRRRRHEDVADAAALGDDPVAPEASDGADPELRRRVWAGLSALPEAYRETLVWRLVEGLSGPEIAARTGLTPASVRVNLCRGMAMLRAQLGKTQRP